MSIAAIAGPRLNLDGPPPLSPLHSLLNTEGVVVAEGEDGRWLNGINFLGYPAGVPYAWDECQAGTFETKHEGDTGPTPQFDTFACYLPVTCSTLNWSILVDQAERTLDAAYSYTVEQALVGRVPVGLGPNPALGDGNVDVLAGGVALSAGTALAYLENAIGATGRRGMIHASPASLSVLDRGYNVDTGFEGQLRTPNGTPIVSGGGYIGAHANGVAPGIGKDWMFASGPVEVRISSLVITELAESLDREDNTVTFRAERYVLATWDTSLQAAVLVDWDA